MGLRLAIALAAIVAGVMAATASWGAGPTSTGAFEAKAKPLKVASVTDGDTIRLTNGKRVRLLQVDSPELQEGECYGSDAKTVLAQLLPRGTKVRLQTDPALDKVDRYGRLLRYVFRGGTNINLKLVREGAATVWYYQAERGRYANQLLSAARGAQQAGKGLWGACPGTPFDPENEANTGSGGGPPGPAACLDGADNDQDGLVDYPNDPGCGSAQDTDERNNVCSDGQDNDTDGATDYPSDSGCASAGDAQETTPLYQCDDGADNDVDGKVDFPDDTGCSSRTDTSEGDSALPPSNCDPSYPGVCIPPPPPDLDCGDVPYTNFVVLPPDPHRFDGDHDGYGCEG